jgi:hypothetical protein
MPDDATPPEPVQPLPDGLEPGVAYWLEMAEADAHADASVAAAALPGNPTGATTRTFDGAVAVALTVIDFWFFNRVIGLGVARPATEATLDAVEGFHAGMGLRQAAIHVANGARPDAIPDWLAARGWTQGGRWVKLWHDLGTVDPVPGGHRIERIGPDRAEAYGDVIMTAFEMPGPVRPVATSTVGRSGWHHYVGYEGEDVVAAAGMRVAEGVAWLGYGSTLAGSRGRGWQTAMFLRRLQDARDLGCHLAVTETGEENEREPVNHSYRNMLRTGFRLAYARRNWHRQG